ncbi:glycine--tRNA ligase subunit beta [Nocardia sp. NPDC049190]|uniref:glycine--tRNA ligase subunit beta n=1 Tax=Nocardia sp. NPDC049190 TaxID=3155650 RepID=UPI0033F3E1AD
MRRGRTAPVVPTDVHSQLVMGLRSDTNMRWNDPALTFGRPIRWLLALLDDNVLPVTAGGLVGDRNYSQPPAYAASGDHCWSRRRPRRRDAS